MDLDTFKPTFLIQIEGRTLSADITQEITSFVFEDNEEEMDVLEISVTDRNLQFVDDPLFREGNEIVARFGYLSAVPGTAQAGVGDLSPRKKAVIKDIDYDFPENGDPTIRIKAYDKGFNLAGKENQKVWSGRAASDVRARRAKDEAAVQRSPSCGRNDWPCRVSCQCGSHPPPGILYSEIAEEIAAAVLLGWYWERIVGSVVALYWEGGRIFGPDMALWQAGISLSIELSWGPFGIDLDEVGDWIRRELCKKGVCECEKRGRNVPPPEQD